jgi:hypothetical protein
MVKIDSESLRPAIEDAIDVNPLFAEGHHFTAVRRRSLAVILHIVLNRVH